MLTYLDANVFIAVLRSNEAMSGCARSVVDDSHREFVVSDYLRLELFPRGRRGVAEEIEQVFLDGFFRRAIHQPTSPELTGRAIRLARSYGIAPLDALHVSAAIQAGADELITGEKPSKPICQVTELRVVSLFQLANPG